MLRYEASYEEYVEEGGTVLIENEFRGLGAEETHMGKVFCYQVVFVAVAIELKATTLAAKEEIFQ